MAIARVKSGPNRSPGMASRNRLISSASHGLMTVGFETGGTRDRHRCWVADCYRVANICDHIDPVTPSTTPAAFHDLGRLRASCREHNLARGILGHDSPALGMTPRPRGVLGGGRAVGVIATIRRDYTARS